MNRIGIIINELKEDAGKQVDKLKRTAQDSTGAKAVKAGAAILKAFPTVFKIAATVLAAAFGVITAVAGVLFKHRGEVVKAVKENGLKYVKKNKKQLAGKTAKAAGKGLVKQGKTAAVNEFFKRTGK